MRGWRDCEAVIAVSEALDTRADKLGADLAGKCRKMLADRKAYCDLVRTELENRSGGWPILHPDHLGWQSIRRLLYDFAAEVSKQSAK